MSKSIVLLGAPGSGKTAVATALINSGLAVDVIDEYAEQVECEYDRAIGSQANYITNLRIALSRIGLEDLYRDQGRTFVTCGSIVETAVYMSMQFAALAQSTPEEVHSDLGMRMDAALRIFSVLFNETFRYDHIFYLPYAGENLDAQHIDKQLQAGAAGFRLADIIALEGSIDERAQAARSHIKIKDKA